jgi:hypothetical protein
MNGCPVGDASGTIERRIFGADVMQEGDANESHSAYFGVRAAFVFGKFVVKSVLENSGVGSLSKR